MKYEGIIINLTKSKAIVTTNDFQCFYIKRGSADYVGKEIEFTEKDIVRKRPVSAKLMIGVACMVILFVIASFSNIVGIININDIFSEPKVFAYIDVDINPSLEIEIDNTGDVMKLVPLNEDAKVLIKKLKFGKINVSKAIADIIDEVKKDRALSVAEKDYILISSTLNNQKSEIDKEYKVDKEKLDNIMNSLKTSLQEESGKVNVYIMQTNIIERKDAQSEGISTGRYVLYNKYKNLENGFSVEEAKKINVNDLLKYIINNKAEKDSISSIPKPTPSSLKADNAKQNETTKVPDIKLNTPLQTLKATQKTIRTQKPVSTQEPTAALMKNPVTVYQNINYTGWAVGLDVGNYDMFQLFRKGILNDEASSIKVASGYKVILYEDYNFTGRSVVLTANSNNLAASGFDNIVSSIKVESDTPNQTSTKNTRSQFMRLESYNFRGQFIRHQSFKASISKDVSPFDDSVFNIVPGLSDPDCISFESKNFPGYYLMHENFKIVLKKFDGSDNFKQCATFRKISGLADKNLVSFQSINYPNRYIRHKMFYVEIDEIITDLDKKDATYIEIKVE
ncbi:AbfB domain-containing protein [Pseudobacteroides cellulosolvens]|uniref:Alpha-L-arabinofuranosidase B n=1 Tax=Pseudobacteroides cellulosolvens ATCC 35603 = DSM 2933 TaxID=398512 RepID=A0A0L6JQ56_9FIRM|nr:AbfB domain-containing protein [Pseudobacteroides cellulosolvens]KNY27820.1 alpha-L-arabinofuranosidase B [Pseudobacteroides cellulosolvens ATCC 35603 = DSM 2933]